MSLIMTPAAYHRIAERGRLSSRFAELASWLIAAAMAPLALSIALDAFVVSVVVAGNLVVGTLIGAFLAMMFVGMWFVWPAVDARRRRR
jgi:membrane-bound ClpP family serine protease